MLWLLLLETLTIFTVTVTDAFKVAATNSSKVLFKVTYRVTLTLAFPVTLSFTLLKQDFHSRCDSVPQYKPGHWTLTLIFYILEACELCAVCMIGVVFN